MAVQISGNDITVPRDGTFTRNVTIGGTLTYEDVTNIDSVGLITARNGIEIGARPGVAASISVDGDMIISGISTFGGNVTVPGLTATSYLSVGDNDTINLGDGNDLKIYHQSSDNNSYIENDTGSLIIRADAADKDITLQAADILTFNTGGSNERARITSTGEVGINMTPSNGQMLAITGRSGYDDIVQVTAVGTNMGARISLTNTGTGVARLNATNNSLALQTVGNNRLFIESAGNAKIEKNLKVVGVCTAASFESATFSKTPTNTPAFHAWSNNVTSHPLSDSTLTKVEFLNSETFDTDSAFDNSTSGTTASRFTVPTGKGGFYQISAGLNFFANNNDMRHARAVIKQNTDIKITAYGIVTTSDNDIRHFQANLSGILELAAGDYIELFAYLDTGGNSQGYISNDAQGYRGNHFSAYKLII